MIELQMTIMDQETEFYAQDNYLIDLVNCAQIK